MASAEIHSLSKVKDTLIRGAMKKTFPVEKEEEENYVLEKNINFIWIGSPIPAKYISNIKTYLKNEDYQITLWVDDHSIDTEIEGVIVKHMDTIDMANRSIFDAEKNMGAKADILRYEIVYNCGGIYCDVDSLSVKPFDENFNHSFLACDLRSYKNVCNGVFGFSKGSKFLKFVIEALGKHYSKSIRFVPQRTGPTFFTTCLINYDDDQINLISQDHLVYKTPRNYTYHTMDKNW